MFNFKISLLPIPEVIIVWAMTSMVMSGAAEILAYWTAVRLRRGKVKIKGGH